MIPGARHPQSRGPIPGRTPIVITDYLCIGAESWGCSTETVSAPQAGVVPTLKGSSQAQPSFPYEPWVLKNEERQ